MNVSKGLVLVTAWVFVIYGILFIFFPTQLLESVTGSNVSTSSAVIDIRATYGGMALGLGIILILLARKPETLRLGLVGTLIAMVGMASGRLLGIIVDQNANSTMYIYLALELLIVAASGYLLKTTADKPSS